MADWPSAPIPPRHLGVISTLTLGGPGGIAHRVSPTSGTWPAANRAIFIPFRVVEPILVRQLFLYNGATAAGNVDVGIYDRVGTRLVSAGSTAQAGTNALQTFDVTDTWLGVGLFYLASAASSTSTTTFRLSETVGAYEAMGLLQMASALPLPATATFAAMAGSTMPVLGLTNKTVI